MVEAITSPDAIIAKLRETAPALKAEGVTRLAIFGSRARGDAKEDSDLDVLIDVDPEAKFSLLNLFGVGLIVEDVTGLKTQVAMRRSLQPRIAERIADDYRSLLTMPPTLADRPIMFLAN